MVFPSATVFTLTMVVLLIAMITMFFKRRYTYWKNLGVYTLSPTIPFGNATELIFQKTFMGDQFKHLYNVLKQKGLKYGGYYFFTKPIFVPVDLELIKRMMNQDFAHFMDRSMYINEELEPLTAHLFAMKGSKWKQLRAKLSPTFTSAKIKMMYPTLLNCTKDLITILEEAAREKKAVDIKEILSRYTTDVVCSCIFGLECKSLLNPNAEFRVYGKKFFHISIKASIVRLLTYLWPELIAFARLRSMPKEIHDFFYTMVTQTVNYREKNGIKRKDFMHILIKLKNNEDISDKTKEVDVEVDSNGDCSTNDTSITLEEVASQCFIFFLGGFETSSTLSTFILYELVQNPKMQDKMRKEINMVLDKHHGNVTYDALMEMNFMEKVINEALRKYPPVPIHFRECTETYRVPDSNVVLEKGTIVYIPLMGIQHDPAYYPDPEKFDPERFSEENKANIHPSAFTPFGDGPRICIAYNFGKLQTKVALATLLRNFRFTLNPNTCVPVAMDPRVPMVLTVKGSIWINVERVKD